MRGYWIKTPRLFGAFLYWAGENQPIGIFEKLVQAAKLWPLLSGLSPSILLIISILLIKCKRPSESVETFSDGLFIYIGY